jgi:hypothetical protein
MKIREQYLHGEDLTGALGWTQGELKRCSSEGSWDKGTKCFGDK